MKHTPGLWDCDGTTVRGPFKVVVADCSPNGSNLARGGYTITKEEAEANARLVAFAPLMARALRSAFMALDACLEEMQHEGCDEDGECLACQCDEALRLMREARL